jgi:hypothetical protein
LTKQEAGCRGTRTLGGALGSLGSDTINELRTTGNSSALPAFARLQGISGQQIRLNGRLEEPAEPPIRLTALSKAAI